LVVVLDMDECLVGATFAHATPDHPFFDIVSAEMHPLIVPFVISCQKAVVTHGRAESEAQTDRGGLLATHTPTPY
jgi:hypothetical protein